MRNGKLLIYNTSVLTIGTILMKSISVFFNVYLTNRIGSAGIGLFQLITTVYGLFITFASGGIKLGATRLVSESELTDNKQSRAIMRICIKYALSAGLITAIFLFVFSGIISDNWIDDKRAAVSLKILSLSLPSVAVSSALNGYFTAQKTMAKYAIIQLSEQAVKILITIISISIFGAENTENACSAIALGITVSELFSVIISYSLFRSQNKYKSYPRSNIFKKLLHISVPELMGSSCRALLLTVEHILIPVGFKKSGHNSENAMSIYGYIHGMALPIILYPSAFISSLSSMLVPELSQIKISSNSVKISSVSKTSLRFALIFSFGAASFFFIFSEYVAMAVYKENSASFYIRLLAVLIPIMYCDMITDGLLKGLDEQKASMRYNIIDSAICVILVAVLVPCYSVSGYIFVLFLSEIINFSLSINRLIKKIGISINIINDLLKPFCCALLSCGITYSIFSVLYNFLISYVAILILCVLIFISLYIVSLFCSGCMNKDEKNKLKSLIKN